VTLAKLVACRRRQNKQRESRKHVTGRSIDWKLVDSIFELMHARFDFILEGCANDEGLNSHSDLPQCSPSDSIMAIDLFGERVFINPPWELAEQIGHHFKSCRRTAPTSTIAVFVLPKWDKFNELTRQWKLYQEFPPRTQLFTGLSMDNLTQQEVLAPAPWHVKLWLVDADCAFYDQAPTTTHVEPISVRVFFYDTEESIATLQQLSSKVDALLTDLTEARPLSRPELTVKTFDGGQLIYGLVDCAATLECVSKDFVRRFVLHIRKAPTKTPDRLANGQRITSSVRCYFG
jgi:hypothetical protein